jgi:hypothetical protein
VTEKNSMTQCVKASISLYVTNSHHEDRPLASSIMYAGTDTIFKVEADSRVAMPANLLFIKEVNTSLWKTKMLITLLSEHLLISKLK